jgi:hypothetical protein
MVVHVPHELAPELDQFHLPDVQFADDLRTPVVAEQRRLLAEVDLHHHYRL